jgi:twitching motility protein PilT
VTYDFGALLDDMVARGASDAHMKARTPVYFRMLDLLERTAHPVPRLDDLDDIAGRLLSPEQLARLRTELQVDSVYVEAHAGHRFRVSFFRQRGSLGLVLRHISQHPPAMDTLGIPQAVRDLLAVRRGLLLVTGPAGSGKTTTVASLLAAWNDELDAHIVTLEDPIEYVMQPSRSVVTQRQVGADTPSYAAGLRHVLRQDPDIVFVGEIRDLDTLELALAAAETGHLVVSTLCTATAPATIEYVIGLYPAQLAEQARVQLSINLQGIVSQVLVPVADRLRRVAVFEVMTPTDVIRNLIRQNQIARLYDVMESTQNCSTMRAALAVLVRDGVVAPDDARRCGG